MDSYICFLFFKVDICQTLKRRLRILQSNVICAKYYIRIKDTSVEKATSLVTHLHIV